MSDYIKREDAIKVIAEQSMFESDSEYGCDLDIGKWKYWAEELLSDIPSADVVERSEYEEKINEIILAHKDWKPIKRGEWKIKEIKNAWGKGYMLTCSECGDTFKVTENAMPYEHFCRNCGADMREREGE